MANINNNPFNLNIPTIQNPIPLNPVSTSTSSSSSTSTSSALPFFAQPFYVFPTYGPIQFQRPVKTLKDWEVTAMRLIESINHNDYPLFLRNWQFIKFNNHIIQPGLSTEDQKALAEKNEDEVEILRLDQECQDYLLDGKDIIELNSIQLKRIYASRKSLINKSISLLEQYKENNNGDLVYKETEEVTRYKTELIFKVIHEIIQVQYKALIKNSKLLKLKSIGVSVINEGRKHQFLAKWRFAPQREFTQADMTLSAHTESTKLDMKFTLQTKSTELYIWDYTGKTQIVEKRYIKIFKIQELYRNTFHALKVYRPYTGDQGKNLMETEINNICELPAIPGNQPPPITIVDYDFGYPDTLFGYITTLYDGNAVEFLKKGTFSREYLIGLCSDIVDVVWNNWSARIFHGDLKLENILMLNDKDDSVLFCIADWDSADIDIDQGDIEPIAMTHNYTFERDGRELAAAIHNKDREFYIIVAERHEVFTLGVLLFRILTKKTIKPDAATGFINENCTIDFNLIRQQGYPPLIETTLRGMLEFDLTKRFKMEEAYEKWQQISNSLDTETSSSTASST